jgi:hypothetical protein
MQAQAVVGLVRQRVVPEGGQPAEAPAAVGPGEAADRHRQAIHQSKSRIVLCGGREVPP